MSVQKELLSHGCTHLVIYSLASKPHSKSHLSFPKVLNYTLLARSVQYGTVWTAREDSTKQWGAPGSIPSCLCFFSHENNITRQDLNSPLDLCLYPTRAGGTHTLSFPLCMHWTGFSVDSPACRCLAQRQHLILLQLHRAA